MSKILIIEDDKMIRDLTQKLLSQAGFEVLAADDGGSGIDLALTEIPDLIISDVMMPQVDGYHVLEKLQSVPTTKVIPFIFLTAKAEKGDIRYGMQLGADDYLTKPFTKKELLAAVESRLKKSAEMQQLYRQQLTQTKAQLRELLTRDRLTNLPNQLALREEFNYLLARVGEWSEGVPPEHQELFSTISVCCVGIDRFDRINETLGYEYGNRILKVTAKRLQETLPGEHHRLIRLNAAEFAIISHQPQGKAAALAMGQKIVEAFKTPFRFQTQDIFVILSMGIALYPRDAQDVGKLLQSAKKAMERAREVGGNQCQIYSAAYRVGHGNLISLETDLRFAIERDEFDVYYQPQISLKDGRMIGVEALLRWHHPQRGSIAPQIFIPLAEEVGLIEVLGDRVLELSCQQMRHWQDNQFPEFTVAVNLSGRQFNQINLHHRLSQILLETNLEPRFLELELTETTLVQSGTAAIRRLNALRSLGLKVAIDDFGTGYSSLGYLQKFPFNMLKIDRSFIQNIHQNKSNQVIVEGIISMAHQLKLTVLAEGVEKQEELDFLRHHNCDEIQGFLFSHPVSAQELEKSPFMSGNFI